MNDNFKHITAINTILVEAERQIRAVTGQQLRLIAIEPPVIPESQEPVVLLRVIASALGMLPTDYVNTSRKPEYVALRKLGAYFLRMYYPGLTLKKAASLMGTTDHSTILYYTQETVTAIDKGEPELTAKYHTVLNAITQWMGE